MRKIYCIYVPQEGNMGDVCTRIYAMPSYISDRVYLTTCTREAVDKLARITHARQSMACGGVRTPLHGRVPNHARELMHSVMCGARVGRVAYSRFREAYCDGASKNKRHDRRPLDRGQEDTARSVNDRRCGGRFAALWYKCPYGCARHTVRRRLSGRPWSARLRLRCCENSRSRPARYSRELGGQSDVSRAQVVYYNAPACSCRASAFEARAPRSVQYTRGWDICMPL